MSDGIYESILETVAQNTKMGRRAFMGFLGATGVLLVSGCTDKTEASGAYAENGKAPYPTATNTPSDAITDPHVKNAYLGDGVEIVGDENGLGFYIDQKNHKISPGAPAQMAGVIDAGKGKGLVYMDKEAVRGAEIVINKNGEMIDQYPLPFPDAVSGKDGLFMAEVDLAGLGQKYGLNAGDRIVALNDKGENDVLVRFVMQ